LTTYTVVVIIVVLVLSIYIGAADLLFGKFLEIFLRI